MRDDLWTSTRSNAIVKCKGKTETENETKTKNETEIEEDDEEDDEEVCVCAGGEDIYVCGRKSKQCDISHITFRSEMK